MYRDSVPFWCHETNIQFVKTVKIVIQPQRRVKPPQRDSKSFAPILKVRDLLYVWICIQGSVVTLSIQAAAYLMLLLHTRRFKVI